MITTSTQHSDFTENTIIKTENQIPEIAQPSDRSINAILNFSRNLEIKKSKMVAEIEYIKS